MQYQIIRRYLGRSNIDTDRSRQAVRDKSGKFLQSFPSPEESRLFVPVGWHLRACEIALGEGIAGFDHT